MKTKKVFYRFNHLQGGVRIFIGPVTQYQDAQGIDYRMVFVNQLPANGPWKLSEEVTCQMCDAVVHPDARGCEKCLECTKDHVQEVA